MVPFFFFYLRRLLPFPLSHLPLYLSVFVFFFFLFAFGCWDRGIYLAFFPFAFFIYLQPNNNLIFCRHSGGVESLES